MVNEQAIKGHWTELRGKVKEKWGALTDDDLVLAEGNAEQLIGIIQRRTGEARESIEQSLGQLAGEGGNWREQWLAKASAAAAAVKGYAGSAKGVTKEYAGTAKAAARDYADTAAGAIREYSGTAREQVGQYAGQASQLAGEQYDALATNFRSGYAEAEQRIRRNPLESIAVVFGTGLIAGVIVGLTLRPRD